MENSRTLQNRYLIEKQIGLGGMGAVYLGIDQRFGSKVAIKETVCANARLSRAFEREAQLLNSLRHPVLPHVIDYFVEGEGQFIVMEYIAGEDLSEYLEREEFFAVTDIMRWADEVLDALIYLHTQKTPVIHRDIKPQNLKLTPQGKIVLLDFGLAKGSPTELSSHFTTSKSIFGYSRSYASLEQIQGSETDPRSDLYSLAATLHHLLTGQKPVDALTRATAILSGESDLLASINVLNSQVPAAVAQILRDAMDLNPSLRPQTASEMRTALKDAMLKAANVTASTETLNQTSAKQSEAIKIKIAPPLNNASKPKVNQTATQKPSPRSKNNLRAYFTAPVRIAAAVLLVCGIALIVFNSQPQFSQATDSNSIPVQNSVTPASTIAETPAPPVEENAEEPDAVKPQPEAEQHKREVADSTAKRTASKRKTAPARTPDEVEEEPETVAVKEEEPITKPRVVIKPVNGERNKKDGGFKGVLNKIGEGAMKFPKAIFKKKKDKKDSE